MKPTIALPIFLLLAACGAKKADEGAPKPRKPVTADKILNVEEIGALEETLLAAGRLEWMLSDSTARDSDPLVKELKSALQSASGKCARSGKFSDILDALKSTSEANAAAPTPAKEDVIVKKNFAIAGSVCPVNVKMAIIVNQTRNTFALNFEISLQDEILAQKNDISSLTGRILPGARVTVNGNQIVIAYDVRTQFLRKSNGKRAALNLKSAYSVMQPKEGGVRMSGAKTITTGLDNGTRVSLKAVGDGSENIQHLLNVEQINAPTYEEYMRFLGPILSGRNFEAQP
ncbi:MAG: hypothetical protein ACK5P7_00905 [Bdellovibrio sp.]